MISFLLGLSGFAWTLWYLLFHGGEKFQGFWEPSAAVLLGLGPICVALISHGAVELFSGLRTLLDLAFLNQSKEMNQISNQLTTLSSAVRTEGLGVLAKYKPMLKNSLFKDGLTLILSGFTADEVRHNITAKINTSQAQFSHAVNLFESLGKLSPGMGLVGTIIGLVQMLSHMSEPGKLGPAMAVALLTTLYGLVLGTVVYTPIAEKISIYAEKKLQLDLMILEGVLLLKEKKSHAHLRDVLSTYSTNHVSTKTQNGARENQQQGQAPAHHPLSRTF